MRVLLSAYACEPGKGSESEVGLRTLLAAVRDGHDVWVLTRPNNLGPLEAYLAGEGIDGVHLEGVDPHPLLRRVKHRGFFGLHLFYERWQVAAGRRALELHRRVGFDLAHHITFASHWTRVGVAELPVPVVIGPVGGGAETPWRLLPVLGLGGLPTDLTRTTLRRIASKRPVVRRAMRRAGTVLVQNPTTAHRISKLRPVTVAPNATSVDVRLPADDDRPSHRDVTVALVGNLTPLKAPVLAVRALARMSNTSAVLEVFGDGPERGRVEREISALGLEGRVHFHGPVPRDELLRRLPSVGVLVHPALHDEAGLGVAEALSLGTPVVCLDHGGPPEVCRRYPGTPSVAVPPTSPDATVRGLASALDEMLRLERGVADTEVHAVPSWEQVVGSAYRDALAAGGG